MPTEKRNMPRSQTSAPVRPPGTTEDVRERRADDEAWPAPARQAGDERGDRGDRMPKGADEPGAGL